MQAFGRIKQIVTAGADAIMVYFDGANLEQANEACHQMLAAIDMRQKKAQMSQGQKECELETINSWHWLRESVPSYDSLLIIFDMTLIDSHGVYLSLIHI